MNKAGLEHVRTHVIGEMLEGFAARKVNQVTTNCDNKNKGESLLRIM
jgi:hypothetical protein